MLNATVKLCFRNHKKEVFDKIKESSQSVKKTAIQRMLDATQKKQINCLKLWMRNTKMKNRLFEEESKIRDIKKRFLSKLMSCKVGRIM